MTGEKRAVLKELADELSVVWRCSGGGCSVGDGPAGGKRGESSGVSTLGEKVCRLWRRALEIGSPEVSMSVCEP